VVPPEVHVDGVGSVKSMRSSTVITSSGIAADAAELAAVGVADAAEDVPVVRRVG
jgi:hypothetical protein